VVWTDAPRFHYDDMKQTTGISRIVLSGFKSIERTDIQLGPLNVLIGANGAGKSNFLSVFKLLNALTEQNLQTFVGRQGGASALLHYGPKRTPRLSFALDFHTDAGKNVYRADLVHVAPDSLIFADEAVEFHPTARKPRVYDFHGGHRESLLSDTIGTKGGAKDDVTRTARFVKYRLDRWRSYHFHDTSDTAAVKQHVSIDDNRYLRGDAGNLAAFLLMLRTAHAEHYSQIRDTVRLVFPRFDDFVAEPSRLNQKQILLTWREPGADYEFGPHQLSDGTLRFICLVTLLLQPFDHPNAPHTITLDEPELGLHPYAITVLASLLRDAAQQVQIVVSTQSASLLSAIDESSVVVAVDRTGSSSTLRRPEAETMKAWLDDYTLGDIWEKGVLGGRPHA
jgi:predicted ATPase